MKNPRVDSSVTSNYVLGARCRGLQGKVVDWVEHQFEEGVLYIHVPCAAKTELSWRVTTRMTIEEVDLADWTSGDFKQHRVFIRNERDRSL
jgi:hypothetical protein